MLELRGVTTVLLDIEGTICPISFVRDVLYPYALNSIPIVLEEQWNSGSFQAYKAAFPPEAQQSPEALLSLVRQLSASDIKDPAWKQLQGFLWRSGYESGEITAPLFPDVVPQLKKWCQEQNLTLAIFSSGSVEAQKLLFRFVGVNSVVVEGKPAGEQKTEDINPLFKANFDTVNAGPKVIKESYEKIVGEMGKNVGDILFLSDNVNEIRAAIEAGLRAVVVDRPGNAPLSAADTQELTIIHSLEELSLVG